jgi:hypothetical protein
MMMIWAKYDDAAPYIMCEFRIRMYIKDVNTYRTHKFSWKLPAEKIIQQFRVFYCFLFTVCAFRFLLQNEIERRKFSAFFIEWELPFLCTFELSVYVKKTHIHSLLALMSALYTLNTLNLHYGDGAYTHTNNDMRILFSIIPHFFLLRTFCLLLLLWFHFREKVTF